MTEQMGLTDFFAMEAGEYLERLDGLVSGRGKPDLDEVLRLARALRGSALMANQQTISSTAAAFERLVRVVREDRVAWDEATKQLSIRAVDDLKVLVRDVRSWGEQHEQRAKRMREELERVAGPVTGMTGKMPAIQAPQALDSGTRAFIGREGASVASALDQAAKALQQNPMASEPLQRVLKVMQPLRGLAVLSELPPMPDLLEGVEQAIGELQRRTDPAPDAALVFNAAAKALSNAAQEIATAGAAEVDSADTQDFARRLGKLLEGDAVPIQSLYFNDPGPHVVEEGTVPSRPGRLGQVELVSHGEHLQKVADELERAQSKTQVELRGQALIPTLRALQGQAGGPLANAVSDFAEAARDALTSGAVVARAAEFAKWLREVGRALGRAGSEDESSAAARIKGAVDAIRKFPASGAAPAPAPAAGGHLSRPPAVSAAVATPPRTTPPAVPAPKPPAAAPPQAPAPRAPAPTPAPRAPAAVTPQPPSADAGELAKSWASYEQLVSERGLGPASLEELLRGAPAPAPAQPEAIVAIETLLYRGPAALERVQALREQMRAKAADPSADRTQFNALIEEIVDLVGLALEN